MHGKVLAGGHRAQVAEILALHSGDKGDAQPCGEERVLAVCLLAATPAGIAEDVDVGRPESQAVKDAVIPFPLGLVVLGAGFGGNHVPHGADHDRIPGGGHADGLRKDGRVTGAGHAVQGLVPGLVVGNAEARDRNGPVFKLGGLFVQSHAAYQIVGAFSRGEFGVEVGGLLSLGGGGNGGECEHEKKPAAKRHKQVPLLAAVQRVRSRTNHQRLYGNRADAVNSLLSRPSKPAWNRAPACRVS